jgi:hypothetical protein
MASKEHKIVRKAQALSELGRLSDQLAERLGIEVTKAQINNKDSQLAEIQRIESINDLLTKALETTEVQAAEPPAKKHSKQHGANK